MLHILIISSLILLEKRRRIREAFPVVVKKLWNEWELRVMVLLSLILQVILISLGSRRKRSANRWVQLIIWSCYLSADMMATTALGALSNSQGQPDSNELTALWAPFLLLHLGGPDTITAYALEDNELWKRHLLNLVQQSVIAGYVLYRSWAYNRVSILTIFMFIPGLVKYGERTWALWYASKEHFRETMLGKPNPGDDYAKFMKNYEAKQVIGSRVVVGTIEAFHVEMKADAQTQIEEADQSLKPNPSKLDLADDATELVLPEAFKLFEKFKRLFVDLILSADDWEESRKRFHGSSSKRAFRVIEVELGFIYDLLYTKAALTYSLVGMGLRLTSFFTTIILFVIFFTGDNHHHYSYTDIFITCLLFIGASILDIIAFFILISSDWAFLWLREHNRNCIPFWVPKRLSSKKRWSNSVAQYNLIGVTIRDKKLPKILCRKLLKFEFVENYYYTYFKEVHFNSKELIFKELKRKSKKVLKIDEVKNLCASRGDDVLGRNGRLRDKLHWSLNAIEFDHSILLWHIATDLCYECDNDTSAFSALQRDTSKLLSDYMLYLLIMCPFMLPEGIGQIRFRDTRAEAERFFKKPNLEFDKTKACEELLKVSTDIRPVEVKGDESKSVLFDACRLAKTLLLLKEEKFNIWEITSLVWIEMLSYAANQCRGTNHAQRLRQGGEFITHVWLLMAHLGIAELFQISQGNVKALLISG